MIRQLDCRGFHVKRDALVEALSDTGKGLVSSLDVATGMFGGGLCIGSGFVAG